MIRGGEPIALPLLGRVGPLYELKLWSPVPFDGVNGVVTFDVQDKGGQRLATINDINDGTVYRFSAPVYFRFKQQYGLGNRRMWWTDDPDSHLLR
jgi:hypothetical protein